MASTMMGSLTFRALGIHARRVLDFLQAEHMAHGGMENGRLGASHRQLALWGVTPDDIRKGLEELLATGFVRRTEHGMRQAGGGDPSRFALTWLPTAMWTPNPEPPTHEWLKVSAYVMSRGCADVAGVKAWLKREVTPSKRGTAAGRKQPATPHLRLVRPSLATRGDA